ncbi:MAG TPA: hypothetical protein VE944_08770 [Nostoc sp.]|uniref:hypothetical protein n=1 Tax=Nostoc sp. TaxID=1180 RepID=UPI002D4BB650|nr:hypothetical protein [Nostoc sp.]HYX14444.1 hypothetical protein [Nostoc sp.]
MAVYHQRNQRQSNSQFQKGFRWFGGQGAIALVNIWIYAVAATVNCQFFIASTQMTFTVQKVVLRMKSRKFA